MMKKSVKSFLFYVVVLIGIIVLVSLGYQIKRLLFGINSCQCEVNPMVAEKRVQAIQSFVDLHKQDSPDHLLSLLRTTFPAIKSASALYQSPHHLHVSIETAQPIACINDTFILIDGGALIEKDFFIARVADAIPKITCASELITESYLPYSFVSLFKQLPASFFEDYALECRSEHELILRNSAQKEFTIVSDLRTIVDSQLIKRCKGLKKELIARGSFDGRAQQHWIADIRFDRQIVLRVDRGNDGKNFS